MKKIMGFLAIIVMAVAVFAATKNVSQAKNVDLASLANLNTANAECVPFSGVEWGRCLQGAQICVWAETGQMECDPQGGF